MWSFLFLFFLNFGPFYICSSYICAYYFCSSYFCRFLHLVFLFLRILYLSLPILGLPIFGLPMFALPIFVTSYIWSSYFWSSYVCVPINASSYNCSFLGPVLPVKWGGTSQLALWLRFGRDRGKPFLLRKTNFKTLILSDVLSLKGKKTHFVDFQS